MTCNKSTKSCNNVNSQNGGSFVASENFLSPEMMSLAEFSKTITHRVTRTPVMSFEDYYHSRGFTNQDVIRGDVSNILPKEIMDRIRREVGTVPKLDKRLRSRAEQSFILQQEYGYDVNSGVIEQTEVTRPIDLSKEEDLTYLRVLHKRHIRVAIKNGLPVSSQVFKDHPDLKEML